MTTFDSANRPTEIKHQNSSGTTLADYQYSYDGVSNVSTWTDSDGTVVTLGYDASDQLTSEVRDNSHGTGYTFTYTYDHNANRLTKVVGTGGSAVTTTNTYGTHDQLLTSGSKSYGYDNAGNCTSVTVGSSVTSISYDYENRVVGISYPGGASNSFAYNGDDLRMQKVDSAGTANYLCDGTSPASAVLTDSSAVYTPGLSERRGSTSKFYHGDNLGSTRGITNSSQTVTDTLLFDAFGNTISRTGTTPTPFGFVGKGQYQTDNDSGLQLLGHRYYDASVGRFISSDPAKAGDNWYAYCDNNPTASSDADGLQDNKHNDAPPSIPNHPLPWNQGQVYKTVQEAAIKAIQAEGPIAGSDGPEMGGWIVPVYGPKGTKAPPIGFRPTKPQTGGPRNMNGFDPPANAVGEWHLHPPQNGTLGPGIDFGDQWYADTGGTGPNAHPMPIYTGSTDNNIYVQQPDPNHRHAPPPRNPGGHAQIKPKNQTGATFKWF